MAMLISKNSIHRERNPLGFLLQIEGDFLTQIEKISHPYTAVLQPTLDWVNP
jgi:hypothetical protein